MEKDTTIRCFASWLKYVVGLGNAPKNNVAHLNGKSSFGITKPARFASSSLVTITCGNHLSTVKGTSTGWNLRALSVVSSTILEMMKLTWKRRFQLTQALRWWQMTCYPEFSRHQSTCTKPSESFGKHVKTWGNLQHILPVQARKKTLMSLIFT